MGLSRLRLLLVLASAFILKSESISQEQGAPIIPPGTGFSFHRLKRLAELRWRYSTPLPHSCLILAEQSRAVAYCRQPSSTVTLGIGPPWDPWPYICSVSRLLFFFSSFVVPPLIKGRGWAFFYNWCSLTTPYSTRGHIKVGDIYILYIFTNYKLTLI
jgi:hypothetical protein